MFLFFFKTAIFLTVEINCKNAVTLITSYLKSFNSSLLSNSHSSLQVPSLSSNYSLQSHFISCHALTLTCSLCSPHIYSDGEKCQAWILLHDIHACYSLSVSAFSWPCVSVLCFHLQLHFVLSLLFFQQVEVFSFLGSPQHFFSGSCHFFTLLFLIVIYKLDIFHHQSKRMESSLYLTFVSHAESSTVLALRK